ncbi:hypothetical protein [Streptomyces sp. NPDC052225]|uniref:hypothetical protein n=1 Tax=Streptomyces sp. NPDC052225 TaxID=3154949 RepID=UPI0034413A63
MSSQPVSSVATMSCPSAASAVPDHISRPSSASTADVITRAVRERTASRPISSRSAGAPPGPVG